LSLAGRRIAITRPASSCAALARRFESAGASVLVTPAIRRGPPTSWERLDRALGLLVAGRYDGVLFTSPAAVTPFWERLERALGGMRAAPDQASTAASVLASVTVGAVGPGTSSALASRDVEASIVPAREDGVSLAAEVAAAFGVHLRGKRFLQPRAEEGREELSAALSALGATVDVVPAYRTTRASAAELRPLAEELRAERCDAVVFASPSAVDAVLDATSLGAAWAIAIGETTAGALRARGIDRVSVAASADDDGLFDAVSAALTER